MGMIGVSSLKVWVALVVAAVSATVVVTIIGVALDAGMAVAATPTRATIEATAFSVQDSKTGEAFAKCPGTKRALGGGMVQSEAERPLVMASGPLDATGITLETKDGDKATQWYAAVTNESGAQRDFKVLAICE